MSTRRNHYVTQYYLRSWCREPEREVMPAFLRNSDGTVTPKEIAPQVTGAEVNLYSFTQVTPEYVHYLEENFFTPYVDTPGHRALRTILDRGVNALADEERFAWAVYLLAANYRQPDTVKIAREMGADAFLGELARDPRHYDVRPDDPESLVEFVAKHAPLLHAPSAKENTGLLSVPLAIFNKDSIISIMSMAWLVGDMSGARFPLLTSDNPMCALYPLDHPRCLISFPLSPTKLFMATRQENVELITSDDPKRIAAVSNMSQCQGANRWVYGSAKLRFVQKYIRR